VVSDNAIVRSGLAEVLQETSGVTLLHHVASITALPADDPPAIVILDLYGQRSARLNRNYWGLLSQGSRIIALCRPDDPPNLAVALQGGTRALLTRDAGARELVNAIQTVRGGGFHVCAELLGPFVDQITSDQIEGQQLRLTAREVEALQWVARGLTNIQIGQQMGLERTTVASYVRRLSHKLSVENKRELRQRAIKLGYGVA
jgi:DNA-binding NarL/FixJ family response regulator